LNNLERIIITQLDCFASDRGAVYHGMKRSSPGYAGFGEAYLSMANYGVVGRWKRHKRMSMNLVVPVGCVEFVFWDPLSNPTCREEIIGENRYVRITVPESTWFNFRGLHKRQNVILNIASIEFDPKEVEHVEAEEIPYKWAEL